MSERQDKWRFLKDNFTILLTIASAAVTIILNRLNVVSGDSLLVAILLILTLLATTELVDKTRRLDRIEAKIERESERIRQAAGDAQVRHFTSADAAFAFMAEAIQGADASIDHAALASSVPRWSAEHNRYELSISAALKESRIRYRYLAALPEPNREKRIRRHLMDQAVKRYFVRYVVLPGEAGELQFHNFMVFDRRIVIMNYPYSESEPERFLAIENAEVVAFYSHLFTHLWSRAEPFDPHVAPEETNLTTATRVTDNV